MALKVGSQRSPNITPGDSFNHWTAVGFDRVDNGGRVYWVFRCSCGEEHSCMAWNVVKGKSSKCVTCRNRERFVVPIQVGDKFSDWTALSLTKIVKRKGQYWLFRCKCGVEKELLASEVWRGRSTKCVACARKEFGETHRGENAINWQGGRVVTKDGYVYLYGYADHPNSNNKGYIAEHILVMSEHLGRPLYPHEEVHHLYGVKDDNRIENLELWSVSQPAGQRVSDKIEWALDFLREQGVI